MLPFTHEQFIRVFVEYNADVWPAQAVAYLLALGMAVAMAWPRPGTGRWVAACLALMWLWTGIAYHWVHFSAINSAAYLFGALFVFQGLLLAQAALVNGLRFAPGNNANAWLGWVMLAYATLAYPALGLWAGFRAVELPMFGITPCPVTIFTFGVFLLAAPIVPRWLLVVPVLWALIGGSAAFLLNVPQDWALLASGFSALLLLRPGASMAAAHLKE